MTFDSLEIQILNIIRIAFIDVKAKKFNALVVYSFFRKLSFRNKFQTFSILINKSFYV